MKTTLLRASMLLGTALCASPALAQPQSATMTTTTTVPAYCSEISVSNPNMNLGSLTGSTGQLVSTFQSGNSLQLMSNFYCNAPSTVTIKATPLTTTNTTTDTSSFTSRVDYTANLTWDDFTGSVSSTVADAVELDATEANIGSLELTLTNPTVANNLRPVAGDYSGQVTLTIALAN